MRDRTVLGFLAYTDTRVATDDASLSSVITLNPAIRYHFKTGQRDWPET
jgi:hypothetical protein